VTARIFVDTSAWFAYANRGDPEHRAVREVLRRKGIRLVTSNFVFDETVTLCRARLGHAAAAQVGAVLRENPAVDLVRLSADDEGRAWELFLARSDKEYSFTDCTSFVLLRRMHLDICLALDDDFAREGFTTLP
jgi:predicted nucleic acid-binding protein